MRILRVLGSWWTLSLLALALLGAYITSTFSENPYERWLGFVFGSLPGIVLYYGLIVTIILATLRVILEKMTADVPTALSITEMDAHAGLANTEEVERLLQKSGFPTTERSPDTLRRGLCLRKGRYSFLPGVIMRAGIVIFLIAVSVSTYMRKTEEVLLSEGKETGLIGRQVSLESVEAGLEEDYLWVGGKGSFRISELSAVLRSAGRKFRLRNGNATRVDGRYYRIMHLGYHQPIRIDNVSTEAEIDVLPPGKAHVVELSDGIGPVSFVLEPEKTVKKGLLTGKIYNLQRPRYRIRIQSEGEGGVAGLEGESHVHGRRVALGSPALYIKVQSTYDPAVPLLYTGFILAILGASLMVLRPFWYEKRFCVIDANGKLLAGYSEEFYKKWGIMKFRKWLQQPSPNELETAVDE